MPPPACRSPARRLGPEPLLTLASYRRSKGRIAFGHLMNVQKQHQQAGAAADQQCSSCSSGGSRHGSAGCMPRVEVGTPVYAAASDA